jgi:hypothetical protein
MKAGDVLTDQNGGYRALLKAEIPSHIVTCPPASLAGRPLAALLGREVYDADGGRPAGSGRSLSRCP